LAKKQRNPLKGGAPKEKRLESGLSGSARKRRPGWRGGGILQGGHERGVLDTRGRNRTQYREQIQRPIPGILRNSGRS